MWALYIFLCLTSSISLANPLPKIPEPLPKEEFLIQPPEAPSRDIPTFGRQLLLHNSNRAIERLKRNDPALGRTITKVESLAKVSPPPVEADNFKLTTGLQLDKGIAFSEVFWYSPVFRSEVNVLHKNTTFKITDGPVATWYTKDFYNHYNLMLVFSTVFE